MEKIVVIGDVHGLRTWEQVVERHPDCKYVFLGDYNDPYGYAITDDEVLDNFRRLIDFKLAVLEEEMKRTIQQLNSPEVSKDTQRALEIMTRYKKLTETLKEMAKKAGDRVILKA